MIHIKRITLRNFKSFKKVSIPVPRGFTAIVGPNGSGKSNIVDAICFVLGRSSAKSLRAERFSDLIFNGGKKGEPAKEAEVSIYFDNSGRELPVPEREVKITRSVDASGNSVYRVNGRRVSRAEVIAMLRQANIHPDGHNIILQGDITRIIEMNPVERRKIIDEIAGIAEYDEKKRKAMRELEKVQENVARASDVFAEVKELTERLRREKEAAVRYRELREQVRRGRALVLASRRAEAVQRLEELEELRRECTGRLERLGRHGEILRGKRHAKQREMEEINREIAALEEGEHYPLLREVERARAEVEGLRGRLSAAAARVEGAEVRMEECKRGLREVHSERLECVERVERLGREIESLRGKVEELRRVEGELYSRLSAMDERSSSRRGELERVASRAEECRRQREELEREAARLGEKLNAIDLEGMRGRLEELRRRRSSVVNEAEEVERRLSSARRNVGALREELERAEGALREKRAELLRISGELERLMGELEKARAKERAAEEVKRSTGDAAVEAVLRLRDEGKVKGIVGTVAELLRCDERYAVAIEVAGGKGLRSIVVESDEVAEECIRYLKEKRIGRASFLPLNRVKPRRTSAEAEALAAKACGLATELVEFDERFYPAVSQVLGNTVVVESLEFARRHMGRVRMVTLEGDLVEASGRITGGYYRRSSAISTERRSGEIEAEVRKLRAARERVEGEVEELRERVERLRLKLREEEIEAEHLGEVLESLGRQRRELEEQVGELEAELRVAGASRERLERELERVRGRIEELEEEYARLSAERRRLEEELKDEEAERLMREVRATERQRLELERRVSQLESERRVAESRLEEVLLPRFRELRAALLEALRERRRSTGEMREAEHALRQAEERFRRAEERERRLREHISELKRRMERCTEAGRLIGSRLSRIEEEMGRLRRRLERANVEHARLQARLEGIEAELQKYGDVAVELIAPIDTEEMEREIARMEAELRRLEPVNMRAIEEYERVREKYEKLEFRLRKLEEERQAILRLVEEIESRKLEVFMEVFDNVAANFRRIFSQLSGGGTAELLLDEQAPLEGGLRIQAKPPGKNPQYIELLSGGERTITALSFLFAIQRYQPAPFYVLDEIDMFLDDSNVRKISEMIKEASKEAQFIVVSLRESMMTAADQLFGVTNQDGVSRIVGVELRDAGVRAA